MGVAWPVTWPTGGSASAGTNQPAKRNRPNWEIKVELSGKKWYVAVIGKPDGRLGPAASLKEITSRLILRPWAEKDKPFLWWHTTQRYLESLSHVKLVTFPYRYAGNCAYSWRVSTKLKGAVTLSARSDLAGLGATEGPATTWRP